VRFSSLEGAWAALRGKQHTAGDNFNSCHLTWCTLHTERAAFTHTCAISFREHFVGLPQSKSRAARLVTPQPRAQNLQTHTEFSTFKNSNLASQKTALVRTLIRCRQGPAVSKAWDPDRAQQAHVAWWVHVDVHRLIKCVESELVARSIDKTTRCVFGVRSVRSCHTLHNIPLIRRRRLWGTLAKKSCPIHVPFVVQS
jgi:hypothetical protein